MDIEKILQLARYHKRTFVALLIAIYIIVLMVAHFNFKQSVADIELDQLKSVAAALITAIFTFTLVIIFIPGKEKGEIIEVPPQRITAEFDRLLAGATRWRYKGNFGRYLRGKVLPTLAARENMHVVACLIDPTDADLCAKHAGYRSSINAIDKGAKYTADTVAMEVVITIVMAAWYMTNRGMQIDIYLSKAYDPIRIDSNDDAMILTVEDRRSPALLVSKQHFTASHFELQMRTAREQGTRLNLGGMRNGIQLAEVSSADVAAVLAQANMTALCDRLTAVAIEEGCRKARNPYEN